MVGRRAYLFVFQAEGVVGLGAAQVREAEAAAEFDPLDAADGEKRVGEDAFQRREPGFPHAGLQARNGGLDDAADGIALLPGFQDAGRHGFFDGGDDGEVLGFQGLDLTVNMGESLVADISAAEDMRSDPYAFGLERGERDRAHGDQGRRDAAAEVAAAAPVLIAGVFDVGGIVRMGRTGESEIVLVIRAPRIGIGDQDAEWRAGRPAVEDAADDAEGVRFAAGGIRLALRAAFGQLRGDECFIHRDAGGKPVQHGADFRAVRFSE